MKFVTPYRPFVPESAEHERLGAFDWVQAIGLLHRSLARACPGVEARVLTDLTTDLSCPVYRYPVRETRLMLWLLDVSQQYLASDAFDEDTVFLGADALVFRDLRPWFLADFGIVVREAPKFAGVEFVNSPQFWRHKAKARLARFFGEALDLAKRLPEAVIRWGADTAPIQRLLEPLTLGLFTRGDLTIFGIPSRAITRAANSHELAALELGVPVVPQVAVIDFRGTRKHAMAAYFDATIGACA